VREYPVLHKHFGGHHGVGENHMVTTRNMMDSDKHTLEEIENHRKDPMVMMLELGKDLKTFKWKNVKEINALRTKNSWMKQNLKSSGTILIPYEEPRDPICSKTYRVENTKGQKLSPYWHP